MADFTFNGFKPKRAIKSNNKKAINRLTGEHYESNLSDARTPEQIDKENESFDDSVGKMEQNGMFENPVATPTTTSAFYSEEEGQWTEVTTPLPAPESTMARAYRQRMEALGMAPPRAEAIQEQAPVQPQPLDERLGQLYNEVYREGMTLHASSTQIQQQYEMRAEGVRRQYFNE